MSAASSDPILIGYGFDAHAGPHLIVDHFERTQTRREKIDIWGKSLLIEPTGERRCIGTYNILTLASAPCPAQRQIPVAKSHAQVNCDPCFKVVGFNPAFFKCARESLSPQQQQYNLQRHFVYLAHFGSDQMKIGTAYHGRLPARWLEQGAFATTIVRACENAYEAREWEVRLCKTFSLPEGVTAAQKKQLLNMPYDETAGSKKVHELAMHIVSSQRLDPSVVKVHNWRSYYCQAKIPTPLADISLTRGALRVHVLGLIGNLLVFSSQHGFGVTALAPLIGRARVRVIGEEVPAASPKCAKETFSFDYLAEALECAKLPMRAVELVHAYLA